MRIGEHVGSLQQIAIPLRRTVNETNNHLWQAALADPARYAQYAVASDDDAVAKSIQRHINEFQPIARLEHEEQNPVTIYKAVVTEQ
jgi:hypothetical protein